jgi:4-amino-4-deoxy-L-arabinose transferase-like glycosyltransferase
MRLNRLTFILLLILIFAAALRFYRIDGQSFWNDEGNSARIAERSLQLITAGAAGDIHPPLYYYVLHFWRGVFGSSEMALRGLSAVLGIVLVWLTYLIAKRLFDAKIGLVAALIAALDPFQIYYSQEARMYMLLAVIGAASTVVLIQILSRWSIEREGQGARGKVTPSPLHLVTLSLLYALGLYTHYAFPFVVVTHFLIVVAWSLSGRQRLRLVITWIGIGAAAGVLFIPWLPIAIRQITTWPSTRVAVDAGAMLLDTLRLYVLGPSFPTADATIALLVAGFFLIVSLWNPDSFDEHRAEAVEPLPHALRSGSIVLWWLVPIALIFGFGLFKESYLKFLLIGSPAFCILLGRGIVTAFGIARNALQMPKELAGMPLLAFGWSIVVIVLVVLMAVPTATSLHNYYFDPKYARDDFRGIAQYISGLQHDGDAVILDSANQWEVFTYYYPDGPNVFPLPKQRPLDQAAVETQLNDIAAKYKRLFVLYWGDSEADPHRVIESWLDAHTYKAADRFFGSVRFVIYAVPSVLSDKPTRLSGVHFGDHIVLDGYSLSTPSLAPSDILQLDLYWHTDAVLSDRYKVFVHVLDQSGNIVAQTDREPGGGLVPTNIWKANDVVIDRYGVLIPANVAAGTYSIEIGLYTFDGARLKINTGGDALNLATIEVK